MALAKLSLGGGGAVTLKVTDFDSPPPGGVFTTAMSSVLPKGPSRAAGRVAVRQVGSGHDTVGAATVIPFCAPLKRTLALCAKFVPVNWMDTFVVGLGVCTGVLDGLMLVSVGVPARTGNVKELPVVLPTLTETLGVPATRREAGTVADKEVSDWVPVGVSAVVPN